MAATQGIDRGPGARWAAGATPPPQPSTTGHHPPSGQFSLPADLADFTGREEEARQVIGALLRRGTAAPVVVLSGPGGAGKTALAVHVGHVAADNYPDARLAIDLRGSEARPLDPDHARGQILRGLGVAAGAVPADPHEGAALYQELTARRRALILLDDAADSAQVRPLLPAGAGCAVLITSRSGLRALAGTVPVELDGLDTDDALTLFARIVGGRRAHPESPYAADVIDACGHLPLAIRIAAALLAARRKWSVESLAGRLHRHSHRLTGQGRPDVAVEASVALSYEWLDPAHARALRLLALPELAGVSGPAATALLGLPSSQCAGLLQTLCNLGLLQTSAVGHYRCHDLIRRYLTKHAAADPAERTAATARLLDHYLAAMPATWPAARLKTPGPHEPAAALLPRGAYRA